MSTDGGGGGGAGEGDFVELLLQEVQSEGLDCGSVQMLVEMAKSGDIDTVADALSYLVEAGAPDNAAGCLRRIMASKQGAGSSGTAGAVPRPGGKPEPLDYTVAAKVFNRLIELGSLSEALELLKFLLVARETDHSKGKMLDCYDVSFILGSMVPDGSADSAGRVLYALYSNDTAEDSAASQTLVPFILGTLIDHDRANWAVELGKQLMYTTLEEIDAGSGEYDYSVMGWCLAQMVWYGRADWAARLCLSVEQQQLEWYNTQEMLGSVASWGDPNYSATIVNFMRDMRMKEGGGGPGPGGYGGGPSGPGGGYGGHGGRGHGHGSYGGRY